MAYTYAPSICRLMASWPRFKAFGLLCYLFLGFGYKDYVRSLHGNSHPVVRL